jgi:hypothetical protein
VAADNVDMKLSPIFRLRGEGGSPKWRAGAGDRPGPGVNVDPG